MAAGRAVLTDLCAYFNYLGLPLVKQGCRREDHRRLFTRLQRYISLWFCKRVYNLSRQGRKPLHPDFSLSQLTFFVESFPALHQQLQRWPSSFRPGEASLLGGYAMKDPRLFSDHLSLLISYSKLDTFLFALTSLHGSLYCAYLRMTNLPNHAH